MRIFLATGNGFATTAERPVLHRNTVQYWVRKAEEAVGHSIQGHGADVELALQVCQVLVPRCSDRLRREAPEPRAVAAWLRRRR